MSVRQKLGNEEVVSSRIGVASRQWVEEEDDDDDDTSILRGKEVEESFWDGNWAWSISNLSTTNRENISREHNAFKIG